LYFLSKNRAKILRDRGPKSITARIGPSFVRGIRIQLDFDARDSGTRVYVKTQDLGDITISAAFWVVIFAFFPIICLGIVTDSFALVVSFFLILCAALPIVALALPEIIPPEVMADVLVEDLWNNFQDDVKRRVSKPAPLVTPLAIDWLRLTKLGPYVCMYNIVALLSLSLTGVVSTTYASVIEGISEATSYNTVAYGAYVAIVLYGIFLVVFRNLHNSIEDIVAPRWDQLRPFSVEDTRTRSTLDSLCTKLGMKAPSLLVVRKQVRPPIFFYGTSEESGTIVMAEALSKALTQDQLEVSLAHELYHAKQVTPNLFAENVLTSNERLVAILIGFPVVGFIALVSAGLSPILGWRGFWLSVIAVLVVLPGFGGNFWLSYTFLLTLETEIPTLKQHEFYADWFAALITRKPAALRNAIAVAGSVATFGNAELAKYVQPTSDQPLRVDELRNFIKPKFFGSEALRERQAVLLIIDMLLNSQLTLVVRKNPSSFSALRLFGATSLTLSLTEFASKLNKVGEQGVERIFRYARDHRTEFNLIVSARNLGLDPELVLYGVFALFISGVLDFA
jgi:Zn-dependent protease with chaperone function